MPRLHRTATLLLAVALTISATGEAYGAPELSIRDQIRAHLTVYPGGKQTSPTEVSYAGGMFVMTFARPPVTAMGADCPSEWFCFYDRAGYGYPRGKLSSCGWQDLGQWGWHNRTEAVHNATGGWVSFIEHGTRSDHAYDRVLFDVAPGQADRDVDPDRNKADHVYRFC